MSETKMGWLCLVLAMTLSAGLLAGGSQSSGAYFSDAESGTIGGTYANPHPEPTLPYALEPGTSKALHWGPGDDGPASGAPIAQLDLSGTIFLDFGEAPAGHGNTRPDVFRVVSLADDPRAVTFAVTGQLADFVTEVRLGDGDPDTIAARATRRVLVRIRIPDDAACGTYTGLLAVHVDGWTGDAHLPMTIDVCDKHGANAADTETALDAPEAVEAPPSSETSATAPPSGESTAPVPATDTVPDPDMDPQPGSEPTPTPEPTQTPVPTSTPVPTMTLGVTRD